MRADECTGSCVREEKAKNRMTERVRGSVIEIVIENESSPYRLSVCPVLTLISS